MSEPPLGQPGSSPGSLPEPSPSEGSPWRPSAPEPSAPEPSPPELSPPAWAPESSPPAWTPQPGARPIDPGVVAAAVTTRTGSWFAGLDPRGWRTTIVAAALMIGTVFGANLVNAAVPLPAEPVTPDQPVPTIPVDQPVEPPVEPPAEPGPVGPGSAVEVGYGLVVYPPAGWTVVAAEPGSVALQRGGVILLALATPWPDDPAALADAYAEGFFADGQFQAATPQTATLGSGIPAVAIAWSGIVDGAQYDGVIAAGVESGTGVVLNAIAPVGQLQAVTGDLDTIAATLQIVPGGQ